MASRKMANSHTLQQKYKPPFDLPKNSVLRLHKAQYRNRHDGGTLTHAPPKKQNGAYCTLENKQTAKHVQKYLRWLVFSFLGGIFLCRKFRCPKYARIVRVNKSALDRGNLQYHPAVHISFSNLSASSFKAALKTHLFNNHF